MDSIRNSINAAGVKALAVLVIKTNLAIVLAVVLWGLLTFVAGFLNLESTYRLYAIGCDESVVQGFTDEDEISFVLSSEKGPDEIEVQFSSSGIRPSGGNLDRLAEVRDSLIAFDCDISGLTVTRQFVAHASALGFLFSVAFLLLGSCSVFLLFRQSISKARQSGEALWRYPLFGIAMAAAVGLILGNVFAADRADLEARPVFELLSQVSNAHLLALFVLAAPLAEELVFRRVALQLWLNKNSPVMGAIYVSAVFAGLHAVVPQDIIPATFIYVCAFLGSLAYCWAYVRSGLLGSWLFHASYNGTLLVPLLLTR